MFTVPNRQGKFILAIGTILLCSFVSCRRAAPSIDTDNLSISPRPVAAELDPSPLTPEPTYVWSQLLRRDAIAPIYEPTFLPATESKYVDDELVIGVEINGDARAYAIGTLSAREMVNDTVGGRPILVTW